MSIQTESLALPPSANPQYFAEFGKEIKGVNPADLTPEQFKEIEQLLYKYSLLLFRNVIMSPEQQYAITKAFDPDTSIYGHGNYRTDNTKKSILHSHINAIPRAPQVQLIGNGVVYNHEGFSEAKLTHPHHRTFHKTAIPEEDDLKYTRFYRWHMDAALYELSPPRVTTLYGIKVPAGPPQILRYDDGTGEELSVPLGATAFISARTTFNTLPACLKSLAVRTRVRYAPHPFIWMATARSLSTGLGLETEGKEVPFSELPEWDESKVKTLPMLWKNPVTGELHYQVQPSAVHELIIDPIPLGKTRSEDARYPDGAHITDLRTVRQIVYELQRPSISPQFVYPHDWSPNDLILFHNRGLLHSVVGAFRDDQVRIFHQCNLAASDEPAGPDEADVAKWA